MSGRACLADPTQRIPREDVLLVVPGRRLQPGGGGSEGVGLDLRAPSGCALSLAEAGAEIGEATGALGRHEVVQVVVVGRERDRRRSLDGARAGERWGAQRGVSVSE